MASTIRPKGISRVHGISKVEHHPKANTQRNIRKRIPANTGLPDTKRPQRNQKVPAPVSSCRLDLTGITFPSKSGYNILSKYRAKVDFSKQEKLKAIMLYNCIKHLPGFVDKQFSDVREAVCYVYQEANRIIGHQWAILTDEAVQDEIPGEYYLQIIYDTIDCSYGRWQSYEDIDKYTADDLELRKAIYMCMKILTSRFGFTIFDMDGHETMIDLDSWVEWQTDILNDELGNEYEEFKNLNLRDYNPETDLDTEIGMNITEVLTKIDELQDIVYRYENKAKPMQKRIKRTKVNMAFLKRQAEKHAGEDVGKWISHIIDLKQKGFCIYNYISTSFKEIDQTYDEDTLMPTSAFGYVFDGDSSYIADMDASYNEHVNNSLVFPFCIHTTVCPNHGIIYTTPNVPLGRWIKDIFTFSFTNLRYEIS